MDLIDELNGKILQNRYQLEEMETKERAFLQSEQEVYMLLQDKDNLYYEMQETFSSGSHSPTLQNQQLELQRIQNQLMEEMDTEKYRIRKERIQLKKQEDDLLLERKLAWEKVENK
ncbi:DUF3958 family protein [Listeria welshimeri]|nr:DUF3958 family protein [Listeria welshimeri]MBC1993554.1 DUF3958 family protein [Listeria welshimeri]MBC2007779.1 DUF3958 family protein [Listeria welshimeri]